MRSGSGGCRTAPCSTAPEHQRGHSHAGNQPGHKAASDCRNVILPHLIMEETMPQSAEASLRQPSSCCRRWPMPVTSHHAKAGASSKPIWPMHNCWIACSRPFPPRRWAWSPRPADRSCPRSGGIEIPENRVVGVFNNDYAVRILDMSTAAMIEAPLRFLRHRERRRQRDAELEDSKLRLRALSRRRR